MTLKKELNYKNKYININNYKLITTCTKKKKQKLFLLQKQTIKSIQNALLCNFMKAIHS